ncbi:unnamed protein product, partial [marine sediment metagenome]
DSNGNPVPCKTWDNAVLLTELFDKKHGKPFPWTLKIHRIMPGEKNTWYINIYGTTASARFSLKNPRRLQILEYTGGEQRWQRIDMGSELAYKTVTGGIFEPGASDVFMQMMAAFMYELCHDKPLSFAAACPKPEEMHFCHRLFTAALKSQAATSVVDV